MNKKCGILLDERYFNHSISQTSPENPKRIEKLYANIRNNYGDKFLFFNPRKASMDDIVAVHSSFYLEQLWEHADKTDPYSYDKDTYLMKESFATAQLAAGGCLQMVDSIMNNEIESGFSLIRPPGHHAEPGRGMGFCILNNIGITARYLQQCYNLKRILVLDFDIHHGNGTQEMFYESNEVLVVSLHQQGIFPFSGSADEMGKENGEGFNINIPVFTQFGDQEYTYLLGRILQSVTEQFMPQIILVSAGFDGHNDDSISGTKLSTEWFGNVTTMLKQYSRDVCDNKLMFILEGGYNPVSLESSVIATLDSLLAPDKPRVGVLWSERANNLLIHHPMQRYWTLQ